MYTYVHIYIKTYINSKCCGSQRVRKIVSRLVCPYEDAMAGGCESCFGAHQLLSGTSRSHHFGYVDFLSFEGRHL